MTLNLIFWHQRHAVDRACRGDHGVCGEFLIHAARGEKTPTPTRLKRVDPTLIRRREFEVIRPVLKLTDTGEIRYSPRSVDHSPCYELRGQQTGVWCVAASVEMLLNYYRYQYDQVRLADELDLGTCASPNGLPYGQENEVVNALENLTSNAPDASMHANPSWSVHRDEIRANRPLISFIPRHSRTVVGYTQSLLHLPGKLPFKGVLVYDPWPPTNCATPNAGGVITRWENFNTQTYRYAFSAVLRHICTMPVEGDASKIQNRARQLLRDTMNTGITVSPTGRVEPPIPVRGPGRELRTWFVPVTEGEVLLGFFELQPDLTLLRYSSFQRHEGSLDGCPTTKSWVDIATIRQRVVEKLRPGERVVDIFLSYDREPSEPYRRTHRTAWGVPCSSPAM